MRGWLRFSLIQVTSRAKVVLIAGRPAAGGACDARKKNQIPATYQIQPVASGAEVKLKSLWQLVVGFPG